MSVIKSLWASVQGDPAFMRKVNGWFTFLWIAMIPISIVLGLLSSVAYVSALSLWALVSGHWSAWQAARVEVEQAAEQKELAENPIEDRVVEQIVAKTELSPAHTASNTATVKSRASTDAKLDIILQRLDDVEQCLSRVSARPTVASTAQE